MKTKSHNEVICECEMRNGYLLEVFRSPLGGRVKTLSGDMEDLEYLPRTKSNSFSSLTSNYNILYCIIL